MLPAWGERRRRTSSRSARVRAALSIAIASTSSCTGLLMKSYAPARMAATAESRLPNAVMTTTGTSGRFAQILSQSAIPSTPGMFRSVTTTSKSSASSRSNAASARAAHATSYARFRSPSSIVSQSSASSSTMSTRVMAPSPEGECVNVGPVTELARDRDPTAMLADDSVGDRQAQARPLADVLRREERLEHARQVLRGDPAPFVADADAEVVGLRPPVIGRRLCSRPVDRELHAPSVCPSPGSRS